MTQSSVKTATVSYTPVIVISNSEVITDRQTYGRQTNKQTDKQTERQTDRRRDRHTNLSSSERVNVMSDLMSKF